jgi:bifunctional non-homologous end joining protein LigD
MSKAKRKGKIYIDYLRNAKTASAVLPYSTRARAGAGVACPLEWAELTARLDPKKLNIKTVPGKIAKRKADPWADYEKSLRPLDLEKIKQKLAGS